MNSKYSFVVAVLLSTVSSFASAEETTSPLQVAPSAPCVPVQPPAPPKADTPWEKLGERVVQGSRDRDQIDVGRADGTFKSMRLDSDGSSFVMLNVVVVFENGEKFSPNTRLVFDKNSRSRVIDLPGEARHIKQVTFQYGNLPGSGRAHIELWAKNVK